MTTKLIILIVVGLLVFGALLCIIVKAWRYRRNHPDEVYWPYNGPLHKKKKSKTCHKTLLVATLILSTLMWTNGLMAQNGTPDGTREHPYPIGDISTLISFAQCINNNQPFAFENGKFVFDIDGNIPAGGAGTYFEQTADIDMNSANWNIPIGKQNKGFEGTYLGGGHKIMNLTLTAANPALFRYSKGHISDLTIENPVFEGTFNDGGALATYVMGGTIDNCHVTGNDLVFNGKDCGALIGWVGQLSDYYKADSIRISNCSNRCHITSTYQQSNANDQNSVAGVVAVINARHYVVTRCFNTGDITSTYRPKFQNDELCFAGVVGRGLLPNYPSEITYCYNRGDITAHCGYLGGVAGFFNDEAGISNNTRCAIDYCFNTGNITGECVLNSDNPSVHTDADSSLNVFSLGGVVAPCKTPTRYCFNTGNVTLTKHPHPKFNIWGDQGVAGVGSSAKHCFNVGEINNYEERNGRAAGVARDTAAFCLNAACVYDRNPKYTFSPHNIARIIIGDCFSDAQMSVDGQDGNLYPTSKIIGESSKGQLGKDWIYEDGRYPRLKWTDTCDWARDIAKVACTPIILADTVTDIHHVKDGIRLTGCDNGVVWKAPEGNCLFVDPTLANTACSNNAIQPALQPLCGDFVTVAATLNGDTIKTVTLLRSVAMPHDTLTVDNLDDLKTLRDGVNTGKAFPYKSYEVPRYADGVTFKLTTDLDMQSERPWAPIGSVFSGSRFAGHFLGGGHTIDNLSLDDATPYIYKHANVGGLFGMLSGEVRDLTFTNLHADSTTIVAGAVCALMNGATIENCIVKGHIETSRSNNNYAISGTAGLAGASLTTRDQDFNFFCRDTIRNCVNYADIITHVGRGANIASHSVGGIIGHGGVVIDCANAGDISGGSECGYIGGIGGDMTSALRCFNTGRVTIAEAPQAIDYFVGGVVGKNEYDSTIMYCYNAGTVDGSDRSPVGGIVGYGAPRYCYMTNTVTGRGKYLGSIAGTVNPNTLHCYYDKQMSPMGGENGQDASGRSLVGLETTGMLGSALQSSLGDPANWIFTLGLYPQLAISPDVETQHAASLRAQLSRVSVMPVVLGPGQNWMSAHDSIPLRGCDEHHFWTKLQGCVTVDSCHVTATDRDMGVIELAATIDSVPYRFVTLKFNMDEKHALVIKNAAQFDTMRMVINEGGYYHYSDSTFHTAIPANADSTDFVAIDDGGNERFFKLITDIDINDIKEEGHVRGWIPVGGFADDCCALYEGNPFKGTFDGGGHTIRHLTFQRYDNFHPTDFCDHHQGLFGTVDGGTVKNLRIAQSDTTLGNSSAFLCSVNKGGTLYHCEIDSCSLTIRYGASGADRHDHALLCAKNEGGTIDSCQVKNSEIAPDSSSLASISNIGGVCALNDRGVVSRCIAEHLSINDPRQEQGALQSVGGICGKNFHGQLQFGTIKNSQITLKMNLPHKFIGGICGLSGYDPVEDTDEQTYAHIPSVISDCNSDSTIINAYTHGDNDSTKSIMNIGGIVGSCQGRIIQLERCSTMENSRILAVADTVGGICGRFCGEEGESYCNTCGNNASVTGNDYVGGIVGLMSGAQLHEGNNQGEVRSLIDFEYNSGYYAGGIAGAVVGESSLFSCNNSGTVAADSSYAGGIAGALMGESNIFLCSNHGDVSGFNQVGGLAGLILKDAWFEWSSNNGLVRGIAQVGGLVGYLKSSTENRCSKSNNYADTIHFSAMGGGVCGYAEDTTMLEGCSSVMILPYDTIIRIQSVEELGLIRDNVNNGSNSYEGIVIVLDWDLNLGNGWTPIGTPKHPFRGTFDGQDHTIIFGIYNESNDYQGFFGYMQGTVKNVNFSQCSVIGRNYVGVIAGYCNGTISNCYSYREKVEGEKYVGGLVGMASYSEIQDCFNGNNVFGEQYVSGIVGDFASCKNDNCYGTMKYDLYGGNVSRCYNYGMVRATGDTSHVGGIAGFTSAEVKHCYNSGIVDGKDFVGGLCGQLDGDNLHHCYNAGYVSATGNNKGAVCGSLDLQNIMYNCFYDRQMCTVQDNNASGYNTLKMTGTALQNVFGTDYWSYHDNEYPTLKTTKKDSTYFRISVKPLLLPGNMPVDKVVQPFCGVTGNALGSQVEWSRYGTATPTVDTIHLADKDSITLIGCGVDTLIVSHPSYGFERLVPIVVAAKEATVETVHTCGSSYKWNKNNKYYYETGFYTCDTCANKPALDLTITPVTITSTLINSTCETIPDGAVLASVTGGPGNGFRYLWTNSLTGDTISNTPALTNITAGYYSVTVTDSLFPTCEQTSPQQLFSSNTVKLTIKSCDASKTYDGTALTGNRYVVTEQGFEPDTLPADSFAILANGDTLRVTFDSNAVNAGTYENKFTYSISNGIDHSCHYDVDTIFGTLSITPRPATIIVNDTSKTYGDEDPVFSGTVTGLVNSDSLVIHYFRSSNIETVGNHPDILTAELNENYTVTIDSGDLTISCRDLLNKIDTANWPDDIENWNECYSPSNTNALPSIDSIKKLIIKQLILANNDTLQPDAFQVLAKDSTILANNCDWKWVRTYTVKISNPNFCDSTSRVIYVSGGDQTAPVHSNNSLWIDGTVYQDACLASFNIDLFFPKDQDLFDDCSQQMTITHTDTRTGDDRDGWTIRRSYVVTDACGHTIYDTIEVSGRDQTPPVASNPEVKNNTLWADSAQCLCDSIRTIHDIEELTTIFGISDACSGEDVRLVSSSKTLETGEHCDYTVIIAYVVADAYGNSTTIYHVQFIQDTIGPTFEIVPHDTTLCVDPDGDYGNTVTRVAAEITVTNLHDNCTKLQESFRVQSSMDTSRFDFYHPRGYRITQGESDNGVRHYKQLWTVTDSCGNTTYDSISIHVRPLPKITRITNREQSIIYGDVIKEVWIYHQYSDLSITGLPGIGLDSLGCSVEHKKDQNNNEYDRVYGDPEFAVTNATFLVTATSHQGWGCSIDSSTFSITVEPRPIVITATDATKKYDGTPLTSNNYTCTTNDNKPALVHDDVISRLSFSGSRTDVGSCENTPGNAKITAPNDTTIDKTSSYSIDYYPGTLTVTVNDTLIKVIPGSASKVYDGTPLTKNEHDDFTVTGVPEGLTWTATADGTVTNVVPGVGEKAVNAVTSFQIFDADGHDVTAYFTNIHKDSIGTLTILPKEVTLTSGGKTREYNGLALTNDEVDGKNANGLTVETGWIDGEGANDYTFTGSQTTVGKCVNAFSYTLKENTTASNYHIVKTEDTLKITANTTPIVITSADSSWMYDGNTHTKPEYTVKYGGEDIDTLPGSNGLQFKLPIGDTLTVTPTCGGVTTFSDNSANNNIFEFTIQHQDQYADITATYGTLSITANTTAITVVPAGGSKPYDGTPLTKNEHDDFSVTGVPEGFTWTATADGTVTNVIPGDGEKTVNAVSEFKIFRGTADVTAYFTNIDTTSTGTLTILPKEVTLTSGSKTREFNGTALTNAEVESTNANGLTEETGWIDGEGATYSFTGSQTTVGKCVNAFSYTLKENTTASNYHIVKTEDTLEITANTTAIKVVPAGGSKTYDGTALTKTAPEDFTVTGVPEGFTWTATADGTVTNVVPGTGEKSENAVTAFNIFQGITDVTNQFAGINKSATATLSITPGTVTLTSGGKAREYNGSALTNAEVEGRNANGLTVETGWVGEEGATYTFTGSQTIVGKCVNAFSYTLKENTTASNYYIIKTEDTLEITANMAEITVVPGSGSKVYDGTPLTKTAHGDFTVTGVPSGFTWTATADGTVTNVTPGAGEKAVNAVTSFHIFDAEGDTVTAYFANIDTSETGTLTITPVSVLVNANANSKIYGEADPTLTATVTGVLENDDFVPSYTISRETGNNVGQYIITPTGDVAQGNYTVTYDTALFTILCRNIVEPTNWPANLPNQNTCFGNADTIGLKDASEIQTLFANCNPVTNASEITVTAQDNATATSDCEWTWIRTYNISITGGCASTTKAMSVSGGDHTAPALTETWPSNIENVNSCLVDTLKNLLYSNAQVKAIFSDCGNFTVDSTLTISGDNCSWTITKTYTVKDACGNIYHTSGNTLPSMSVSGGDHTKPSFNVPAAISLCANDDGSFNISPDITGNVTVATDNCTASDDLTVSFTDGDTITLPNGKRQTIRTWTVTDACGNDSSQTQTITINPPVELDVTNTTQTIILGENIENVHVSYNYADLSYSTLPDGLSYNSSTNILSGIPTEVGDYTVTFTAASDQTPSCGSKQETVNITVLRIQAPVVVTSDSAVKFYDGLPLVSHHYTVTLGQDTIPADDATGLLFTLPYGDKITVTPNPESTLTNAGSIDNLFSCVLENPHHYESFSEQYGKLIINRATLSMELDTARTYDGHPLVVTADQLHITGLAATDIITSGTITTDGYSAGTYVCEEGGFNAFMENGVAIKSDFAINNGLSNYTPVFNVTLRILPITEGFECPDDLLFVLTEGTSDTMVTLPASATLTPSVERTVISNNLESLNPLPAGTHTIVWILSDDLGNAMTSCEQTVTVEYTPCVGVTYHDHFYDAVRIGSQCWLTENLRNSQTSNNDAIANYHAYKDDEENLQKFGYLYSWYSAMNVPEGDDTAIPADSIGDNGRPYVQGICPTGWAVGNTTDFAILSTTVGDATLLKDAGASYWATGRGGVTPNSGFNARGGGLYNSTLQRFEDLLTGDHYWKPESTPNSTVAGSAVINYFCDSIMSEESLKTDLRSVRCIRKVAQ